MSSSQEDEKDPVTFSKVATKLGIDVVAGSIAGALVTPIVSAVDRALAENASGRAKLWPSFFGSLREYARAPISYIRGPQFVYIWLIYGGTYIAANVVDTVCTIRSMDSAFPKWAVTSVTNTSTCIVKDRAFARLFGTSVPSKVPMGAYAAWLTRDLTSMGVFFTMPPIVGAYLADYMGDKEKGYYAAQFALPLMLQTITTPIHLLGYDIYNNPNGSVNDRISFLKKDYFKNVSIRMLRMAPPWSLGTIGNRELRAKGLKTFNLDGIAVSPVYHLSG